MSSATRARLAVVAAGLLFSTGGAAIKACSLNNWQVASLRSGVAALFLLAALPAARRRWTVLTLLVSVAYAGTMVLFVSANKLTTAANSIFLQSTAPLYLLLLGPWLLDEPLRRRDVVFLASLAAGMGLLFVGETEPLASAPNPPLGNAVALVAGLCWALTLAGMRWMERRPAQAAGGAASVLAAGNVLAFLACLPLALPLSGTSARDLAVISYLGIFQIGLAYLFFYRGIRQLSALEVSLLVLVEPVLNPLWAWIVQGETPGPWTLAGGAAILGATAWKTWRDARSD